MGAPQLNYAGPRTPSWKAKPSPLLVGGAALAVVFYILNLPFTPVSVGRSVQAKLATSKSEVSMLDNALDLVDAFGYGPEHLRAAIATGAEASRQDEARTHFRKERASGTAPADEKSLLALKASKSR